MPAYRIYSIGHDDHIVGVPEKIEYDSDHNVIAHAKARLDGLDLEIWDGPRVVIRLSSVQRACPSCSSPMLLKKINADKPGFESRMFVCPVCGEQDTKVIKILDFK